MAGDRVDGRRPVEALDAGRHRPRRRIRRVLAAEEEQADGDEAGILAVLADQVEHRRGAVAQRACLALGARKLHRRRQQGRLERGQAFARGHRGQHRARPVGAAAVQEVVVHLHHDPAARRERHPETLGEPVAAPARRPGGDPRCIAQAASRARRSTADPGASETAPARPRRGAIERVRLGDALGSGTEQDHVVDEASGVRLDPDRRCECVGGQLRVEHEAAVVVGAAVRRAGRVRRRQPEAKHGLSGARTRGRDRWQTHLRTVDSRAGARPAQERVALGGAEGAPVLPGEASRLWPRRPRRHPALLHGRRDQRRLGGHVVRGAEGERCDPTQPVTARALVTHDRRHVSSEARRRSRPRLSAAQQCHAEQRQRQGAEAAEHGDAQARSRRWPVSPHVVRMVRPQS